jgi:hypothetical protein
MLCVLAVVVFIERLQWGEAIGELDRSDLVFCHHHKEEIAARCAPHSICLRDCAVPEREEIGREGTERLCRTDLSEFSFEGTEKTEHRRAISLGQGRERPSTKCFNSSKVFRNEVLKVFLEACQLLLPIPVEIPVPAFQKRSE